MSVHVPTQRPADVLRAIYKAIDDNHIRTWRYMDVNNVRYLTHSADQWDCRAWFRPRILGNTLIFNIVRPVNHVVPNPVYAVYHGRMIEMLISHYASYIGNPWATPHAAIGDDVSRA